MSESEKVSQGAELRKHARYVLPDDLPGKLYILDQNNQIIFEANIRDISFSGLGLQPEQDEKMKQLFLSLRSTNQLRFEQAIVAIGDFKIASGVLWVWSKGDGSSGIEFLNMSFGYQDRLKSFLKELEEKQG